MVHDAEKPAAYKRSRHCLVARSFPRGGTNIRSGLKFRTENYKFLATSLAVEGFTTKEDTLKFDRFQRQ